MAPDRWVCNALFLRRANWNRVCSCVALATRATWGVWIAMRCLVYRPPRLRAFKFGSRLIAGEFKVVPMGMPADGYEFGKDADGAIAEGSGVDVGAAPLRISRLIDLPALYHNE